MQMKKRIPVVYVGKQKGATDDEYLDLVNEPGGFTKVFDPIKHVIQENYSQGLTINQI